MISFEESGDLMATYIDYEAEYNNRVRVPEHRSIIEGWIKDAEAYRQTRRGRWNSVRYGDGERHQLDIFLADDDLSENDLGVVVVFIHGGYWQALDRSAFSHVARGLNLRGISVAIPSYDLCPKVGIPEIIGEMREASRVLARRARRLIVSGHSAGGHLAACLLATDWKAVAPDLPEDLVASAYSISGVFDLTPLINTSINGALRLDTKSAQDLSPLFWPPPRRGIFDAVVGGAESTEFLKQSKVMAEAWGKAGFATRLSSIRDANHFSIIAQLTDPQSEMSGRLAELAMLGQI